MIGNSVENMHLLLLLRGDNCPSLPNRLEAFMKRYNCFKQAGCEFATKQFRDACAQEPYDRDVNESLVYKKLIDSKRAAATGRSQHNGVVAGRKALHEEFSARIYMKRSGSNYEIFYRDLSNSHVPKLRE